MTTFSSKASQSQSHKRISISQSTSTTRFRSFHALLNKRSNLIPPVKYQYPTIGDPLTTQPTKEMEDLINLTDESIQIQPRVSAISLQLPPFFASNPRLWFANIEALFHIQSVRTKRRDTRMWYTTCLSIFRSRCRTSFTRYHSKRLTPSSKRPFSSGVSSRNSLG